MVGGGVVAGTVVGGAVVGGLVGGMVGGVVGHGRWMVRGGVKNGAVVHDGGRCVVDDDGRAQGVVAQGTAQVGAAQQGAWLGLGG